MVWTLRFLDGRLQFCQNGHPPLRRSLAPADYTRFTDWISRYECFVKEQNHRELGAIGREMFAWLDDDGHNWGTSLADGTGEIGLDIVMDDTANADARPFFNVPWELLALPDGNYLAENVLRPYCLQRRVGQSKAPRAPRQRDLSVIFMAAAPHDVEPTLDYEAEEAGILAATANLPLALTVEESGCTAFLKDRLAADKPIEVLHLSCHSAIGTDGRVLALEDAGGGLALTTAAQLSDSLGEAKPGLLFLSTGCSVEHSDPAALFAVQLLRSGMPAVLGWDGSVYDTDASHFARELYIELARYVRPALAVAKARQRLLANNRADPLKGRHWHMARLYVAPEGGGALCAPIANARPSHRGLAYRTFLDKERGKVPVAGPATFVGRRHALQDVFRAFSDPLTPGVLILGFGGSGKTSLAARVADRCPHHKTALVFEFYDADRVFDAALQAVSGAEAVRLREEWGVLIAAKPSALKGALEAIVTGPCAAYELDGQGRVARQPLLLVIDDLERILEMPAAGQGAKASVQAEFKPVLAAVLEAFAEATGATQSHLILTSRYDFELRNAHAVDLAERPSRVWLRPFDDLEQKKQQHALAHNQAGAWELSTVEAIAQNTLLARCRAAAAGNPLVQATLTRTALAEPAAAEAALAAMEAYFTGGANPDQGELADMFKRLAFEVYRAALTRDEAETFRALTLFAAPVPESACHAAARCSHTRRQARGWPGSSAWG